MLEYLKKNTRPLWPVACLLASGFADASERRIANELYFSGHATIGGIYNTDDDVQYFRNLNQRNSDFNQFSYESDSRFGLRFSYRPHKKLGGELQLLTRYGQSNEFETNVFSANLRYKPRADWLIRAGIVPLEVFYRADTIHVGYASLWARPPSEVYTLNLAATLKGLSVQKQFYFGFDSLEVKGFYGYLGSHYSTHPDDQYNAKGTDIYGATLEYYRGNFYFNAGYTHIDISEEGLSATRNNVFTGLQESGEIDPLQLALVNATLVDEPDLDYGFIGIGYEVGPWRLDATVAATTSGLTTFNDTYNGYFSVGYKYKRWTPYFQFAFSHNNPPTESANSLTGIFVGLITPPGVDFTTLPPEAQAFILSQAQTQADLAEAQIIEGAQEGQANQKTYTIGARYDLNERMSLKAQISHTDSPEFPTFLWRNEAPDWDGNTNLISLVLDVTF